MTESLPREPTRIPANRSWLPVWPHLSPGLSPLVVPVRPNRRQLCSGQVARNAVLGDDGMP